MRSIGYSDENINLGSDGHGFSSLALMSTSLYNRPNFSAASAIVPHGTGRKSSP